MCLSGDNFATPQLPTPQPICNSRRSKRPRWLWKLSVGGWLEVAELWSCGVVELWTLTRAAVLTRRDDDRSARADLGSRKLHLHRDVVHAAVAVFLGRLHPQQ